MSETGVVKFACEHVATQLPAFPGLRELNDVRRELRARGWLGVYEQGIGFGNISVRDANADSFFISGTGTGALSELTAADCARVTEYDFTRNRIRCEGALASSESLTHAAIYSTAPHMHAVIHCHSAALWSAWLHSAPTTSASAEYGTPAMAVEVQRLFRDTDVLAKGVFAMAGHQNGVVAFGATIAEAHRALVGAV